MDRVLNAAHEARSALGAAATEPLPDLLALVEEGHGVPVGVLALDPGLAGANPRRPRGALILLNGADAAQRLRFTLAHELGHHVLEHEQSVDTHAALARPARAIEIQANKFAAELLVPVPAVRAWLERRDASGRRASTTSSSWPPASGSALRRRSSASRPRARSATASGHPRIRAEIDDNAHLDLRHRRRLPDLDDGLARARERMPRVRPGSALDAYARGHWARSGWRPWCGRR